MTNTLVVIGFIVLLCVYCTVLKPTKSDKKEEHKDQTKVVGRGVL